MGNILVLNGDSYSRAVDTIGKIIYEKEWFLKEPNMFDLVLFTGGEDISPELYGHTSPKNMCTYYKERDEEESEVFKLALQHGIPMTGICRGCQLLNVLSGGVLLHHIDGHNGGYHSMVTTSGETIAVSSTHHQMCITSKNGYILGISEKLSHRYFGDKDEEINYTGPEVEAIYYPDTKVFAVQYHPEYMNRDSKGYRWYEEGVRDLIRLTTADFQNKYINTPRNTMQAFK